MSPMKTDPRLKIIMAGLIWASSGPFIKYIQLPATTLSFFRGFVPVFFLAFFFFGGNFRKLWAGNIQIMLFASVLNALRAYCYYTGYNLTTIGNVIIIVYSWPIIVALLSIFF